MLRGKEPTKSTFCAKKLACKPTRHTNDRSYGGRDHRALFGWHAFNCGMNGIKLTVR